MGNLPIFMFTFPVIKKTQQLHEFYTGAIYRLTAEKLVTFKDITS
jgi:hypothetical protein